MNVIDIPLGNIEPDPDQPRKYFDESKLHELAVSIREKKVLQPITVRPHPTREGLWMLIFGERRWRASEIAGMATIPSIVEEIDDQESLERQLIENAQRVDIPPLDEAEAYQLLLKRHGHTIETLMSKTGKSRSHLYQRMKLLELAPGVKKALAEGKLPVAHAELIVRLADRKLQEQCCREVLGKGVDQELSLDALGIMPEEVSQDGKQYSEREDRQPLSFRATQALIRRHFATKLSLARFEPSDESLTSAGACGPCPHRSGNQPELPGVPSSKGEDLCTKPSCFEEKTKATWTRVAAAAKDRGIEVLDPKDVKDVFAYDQVSVSTNSSYIELDQELPYNLAKTPGKPQTYAKLLGKRAAEVPRVLVQDGSGAPRELLDKAKAVEILRELGKVDKPAPSKANDPMAAYKKERKADREKVELRNRALDRMARAAIVETSKDLGKRELGWLRLITEWVIELVEPSLKEDSAVMTGVDMKKGPWKKGLLERANSDSKLRQLLTGLLFADAIENSANDPKDGSLVATATALLGIDDFKTTLAAIKESDKLEEKLQASKAKAKKPPLDDGKRCGLVDGKGGGGGGCIHELGHQGVHSNDKRTWSDPKKKGK